MNSGNTNIHATLLQQFEPIYLEEIAADIQESRLDQKFLIPKSGLAELLAELQQHYRILEVSQKRLIPYETVYFDTDDFLLYRHHQCGKASRYKLRYRHYADTQVTYFEVKKKNNKQITEKFRLECAAVKYPFDNEILQFIEAHQCSADVRPVMDITYNRITLVGKTTAERITFDLDLHMKYKGRVLGLGPIVIVELKQPKRTRTRVVASIQNLRLKECSISKYCLAVSAMVPGVRTNNFKPLNRTIEKLQNEN